LRYPVFGTVWPEPEPEPDTKKRPDIRQTGTGTGYPVHPYCEHRCMHNTQPLRCTKSSRRLAKIAQTM